MAVEVPRFALCAGCGRQVRAHCARCHALVCEGCSAAGACRVCELRARTGARAAARVQPRRAHPNAFAHGLLTILWSAATLGFTFGLEPDAAWTAYLLAPVVATLAVAVACA